MRWGKNKHLYLYRHQQTAKMRWPQSHMTSECWNFTSHSFSFFCFLAGEWSRSTGRLHILPACGCWLVLILYPGCKITAKIHYHASLKCLIAPSVQEPQCSNKQSPAVPRGQFPGSILVMVLDFKKCLLNKILDLGIDWILVQDSSVDLTNSCNPGAMKGEMWTLRSYFS